VISGWRRLSEKALDLSFIRELCQAMSECAATTSTSGDRASRCPRARRNRGPFVGTLGDVGDGFGSWHHEGKDKRNRLPIIHLFLLSR
jgi:hypothetical protein